MKIAIYSGSIPSTTYIENLIRNVAKYHSVYLFGKLYKRPEYENLDIKIFSSPSKPMFIILSIWWGILILFIRGSSLFFKLRKQLKYMSLRQRLREYNILLPIFLHPPDVFHVQGIKLLSQSITLKKLLGFKLVLSLREDYLYYSPLIDDNVANLYRTAFPHVDAFHAVTQAIAREAQKYGAKAQKIKIIRPGVDGKLLLYHSSKYTSVSNHPSKIISIGCHHWRKGYTYALDAMKILKDEGIDFHYTIVAKGKDKENILFQIHDLGLKNHVTLIPGLPYDQTIEKLVESDLFLLPSLEEGIASTVLDAMAVGIPVISTDSEGIKEVINSNENSIIVPIRDPESMADAIIKLLKMPTERIKRLVNNAENTIRQKYLINNHIDQLIKLYRSLYNTQ